MDGLEELWQGCHAEQIRVRAVCEAEKLPYQTLPKSAITIVALGYPKDDWLRRDSRFCTLERCQRRSGPGSEAWHQEFRECRSATQGSAPGTNDRPSSRSIGEYQRFTFPPGVKCFGALLYDSCLGLL